MLQSKKGDVIFTMRRKFKKEALDVIVQKIANDVEGVYLADLIKINDVIHQEKNNSFDAPECQAVAQNIRWLYGYENELSKALESLKNMLEKKVFNGEAAYVSIISCMACYTVLVSIFNASFNAAKWNELFEDCRKPKLIRCLEILQMYCPREIDVDGFCDARRYIRLWDSTFNW